MFEGSQRVLQPATIETRRAHEPCDRLRGVGRAQCAHDAPTRIARRRLEARRRLPRSGRLRSIAGGPRTPPAQRTFATAGTSRAAHIGAEIEQRLVPRTGASAKSELVGERLDVRVGRKTRRARQHTSHIRVHSTSLDIESEGRDGARCVLSDAGQLTKRLHRSWKRPTLHDRAHGAPQVQRSPVVPEVAPRPQDGVGTSGGESLDGREPPKERPVGRHNPSRLRLLEHHLRHENAIRIAFIAPRQWTIVCRRPAKDRPAERSDVRRAQAG